MNARNAHLIALAPIRTVNVQMTDTLMVSFVGIVHMAQMDCIQGVRVMIMVRSIRKQALVWIVPVTGE